MKKKIMTLMMGMLLLLTACGQTGGHSACCGNCYIEDESAYGTFHIGFGRNIALGGIHEACGHFDLVTFAPDIYMDGKQVMRSGELCLT